jgi:hypothetical protein
MRDPALSRVEGPQFPMVLTVSGARSFRPVSHSAIARRSSPLSPSPWYFIDPAVSASMIACGDRPRSASGEGARASSPLWQPLQWVANRAAPVSAERVASG